jgi:hypothetical protein
MNRENGSGVASSATEGGQVGAELRWVQAPLALAAEELGLLQDQLESNPELILGIYPHKCMPPLLSLEFNNNMVRLNLASAA